MSSKPAILLVDHGSRRAEANAQLESIAQQLRERDPERIVRIAHMELASPTIDEGLANCVEAGATEIVVHPYMLAPGRHSREDIPALAARAAAAHPGITVRVSEPLGVHEKLIDVVLSRVDEADR
ncbi:MAG: CbiX/SirB N-terminal domain-containing protein [Myxococcota bacterium]